MSDDDAWSKIEDAVFQKEAQRRALHALRAWYQGVDAFTEEMSRNVDDPNTVFLGFVCLAEFLQRENARAVYRDESRAPELTDLMLKAMEEGQ